MSPSLSSWDSWSSLSSSSSEEEEDSQQSTTDSGDLSSVSGTVFSTSDNENDDDDDEEEELSEAEKRGVDKEESETVSDDIITSCVGALSSTSNDNQTDDTDEEIATQIKSCEFRPIHPSTPTCPVNPAYIPSLHLQLLHQCLSRLLHEATIHCGRGALDCEDRQPSIQGLCPSVLGGHAAVCPPAVCSSTTLLHVQDLVRGGAHLNI